MDPISSTRVDALNRTTAQRIRSQLLSLFFGLLLFSAWGLSVYVSDIVAANRAVAWPTSEGQIIFSAPVRGCGNRGGTWYWPQLRYTYRIDDQTYVGDNLAFGNIGCGNRERAEHIAQQYPLLSQVTVHVNPDNPSESVLMAGAVLDDTWTGIYVFAGMILVCAAIGLYLLRK
jgi:hypothetical protein